MLLLRLFSKKRFWHSRVDAICEPVDCVSIELVDLKAYLLEYWSLSLRTTLSDGRDSTFSQVIPKKSSLYCPRSVFFVVFFWGTELYKLSVRTDRNLRVELPLLEAVISRVYFRQVYGQMIAPLPIFIYFFFSHSPSECSSSPVAIISG